MPFNSFEYFLFLTIVVASYWALPIRWRPHLLLAASYLFYGSRDWRIVLLLAACTLYTYWLALAMAGAPRPRRRWLLAASAGVPLAVLFAFKALNILAIGGPRGALGILTGLDFASSLVPIGLSYYTFQTVAYVVDVYRQDIEPERDLVIYGTYVAFFPHLLAGPIVRPKRLIPQIASPPRLASTKRFGEGLQLILIGLFKKVAVADPLLAACTDSIRPGFTGAATSTPTLLIGTIGCVGAAYFDAAGYVDMARGSAKLLSIEMQVNFAQPLTRSRCFTYFWRRWQMTLMAWFRDYVYRPIRNLRGARNETLAIFGTFLITGLWHGLSMGWLVWGLLTGAALTFERRAHIIRRTDRALRSARSPTRRGAVRLGLIGYVLAILLATMPWVFADDLGGGLTYYRSLVSSGLGAPDFNLIAFVVYATVILVLSDRFERSSELMPPGSAIPPMRWVAFGAMVVGIVIFGGTVGRDFFYVQF